MKKLFALTIPILLLLTLLAGCGRPVIAASEPTDGIQNEGINSALDANENEPASLENQQGQTPIVEESPCPYTFFRHGNRLIEDSAFTSEIWNALRIDDWVKIEEVGQRWESSTHLVFYSDDEPFHISIVGTEEVWVLKPMELFPGLYDVVAYYNAPAGTYNALTVLLTDYMTENFMYDLTPQKMNELMYSSEYIHFIMHRGADFTVQSSSVGRFMDEWDLDNWEEFMMPEGAGFVMDERVISIISRNSGSSISIIVALDYLEVTIFYEWGTPSYRISQETADTIERQFWEFQELAIPR